MHSTNYADRQLKVSTIEHIQIKFSHKCYESINIYIKRLINIRNVSDTDSIYISVRLKMIHRTPFNYLLA